jgi:hypothetical protein
VIPSYYQARRVGYGTKGCQDMIKGLFSPCRGVGERRGRVHRAVRVRGGERQPHGAAHHDQRLQDCFRGEGHRCHSSLSIF